MYNGNISPFSPKKLLIKRKAYSRLNISKNLHLMNLPEFHLNQTIKAYINNKLNKTNNPINTQNLTDNNIPIIKIQKKSRQNNQQKNLPRINTLINMLKPKKIFINKNFRKIKQSFTPKSEKAIYKSKSKSKLNINNYIFNYQKKSFDKRKKNKSHEKSLNNTIKKSKFNKPFFEKEKKINIKFSKLNKLKNKSNEIKNIIMKTKNINNNININLDNSFSRKSFNIINSEKNDNLNLNYINNTENNIIYNKTESNHIYFHDCNISDKTLSKIDNISTMNNKSIDVNMSNTNQKIKDDNPINTFNTKNDNSFEYIKKIEKLENENKFLKNEISDSKYKLQLLEDKINKLLLGKNVNLMDKEECPQPTPYVKKYSTGILQNNK